MGWEELPERQRDETKQTRESIYQLTDWPLRPISRMSSVRWQPRRVHVTWTRVRDGYHALWGEWTVRIGVHGWKVKKDGSDALQAFHEPWPQPNGEWQAIVDHSRPAD